MSPLARVCAIAALVLTSLFDTATASPPPYPSWPLPPSAPVMAQGRRGMNPPNEFGLFYNCHSDQLDWFNFSVGQTPFRQDCRLIPAATTTLYPRQGPHMIELFPGGRPAY